MVWPVDLILWSSAEYALHIPKKSSAAAQVVSKRLPLKIRNVHTEMVVMVDD